MFLSQQKTGNFLKTQPKSKYLNTDDFITSKVNVFPPKMHRIPSTSSNVYLEESTPISLSQQSKTYKNYSKNKDSTTFPPMKTLTGSYNSHSEKNFLSNKDLLSHRYSCNIDLDKNSDFLKNNPKMYFSTDCKTNNLDLETRVKELEQKMKKNQENLKYYCEQIDHFKLQISSSSSNLLDSINTNNLTSSTRQPLKQVNFQSFSNKENLNKNILYAESVTNSPKDVEIQKKIKEIDLIKKQIKKIVSKEQNLKNNVKMFHESMKDMLKSFKDHLERSLQSLMKRQDKNKKKIFDQVNETINEKFKEFQNTNLESIKNQLESLRSEKMNVHIQEKVRVSNEKFLGDKIMIKVREEVFGLKKSKKVGGFSSYVEMIKKSIDQDLGRVKSYSSYESGNERKQNESMGEERVGLQQCETTYFIDSEGYLLDGEGYYLVMGDEKILLNSLQLEKLQSKQLLQ